MMHFISMSLCLTKDHGIQEVWGSGSISPVVL